MSDGLLRCRCCRGRTSLTAGTVFQDTRKPLRMWFLAMWFVTSQKNGVSALGLQAAEKSGRGIGRIRLRRVKDVSADSLLPFVQGAVVPGSVVHTDG